MTLSRIDPDIAAHLHISRNGCGELDVTDHMATIRALRHEHPGYPPSMLVPRRWWCLRGSYEEYEGYEARLWEEVAQQFEARVLAEPVVWPKDDDATLAVV